MTKQHYKWTPEREALRLRAEVAATAGQRAWIARDRSVVPCTLHLCCEDGNWYPLLGKPFGLTFATGPDATRIVGFVSYSRSQGATVGQRYPTEQAWAEAMEAYVIRSGRIARDDVGGRSTADLRRLAEFLEGELAKATA